MTSVQLHSTYTIILLRAIYKAYLSLPKYTVFVRNFRIMLKFQTGARAPWQLSAHIANLNSHHRLLNISNGANNILYLYTVRTQSFKNTTKCLNVAFLEILYSLPLSILEYEDKYCDLVKNAIS